MNSERGGVWSPPTEMFERWCRQTRRKVCIKLSNVIRCVKSRCAFRLGLKVIWFNNLIFVKLTWPHPKDSKILCVSISVFFLSVAWYMFYLFSAGLVWKTTTFFHVLVFLNLFPVFVFLGFARFLFPIITFYFFVFFVVSFSVSCFILKVFGFCPGVWPVSN